ncbi:tetratricopeptide repeat-containing sulfotransferase family protein [Paraglaciecola sp. 2405UD69-4]|uniref:tetratricopeptide repeat-containing sulfotransferase family protein n=1 Tax=Paraglaciecola sp. 2405UD69-4 TaxID=3391836 RepID=UPI0039C9EA43
MATNQALITSKYQSAFSAFQENNIEAAHRQCVEILNIQPNYHQAYYLLSLINTQIHQYNKAAELLKRAIQIADIAKYRIELAKSYSLLGISDAVIAIGNTVDITKLTSFYELDTLGVIMSRVGVHSQALKCFRKANGIKATPETLYNYGVAAKFCGENKEAHGALKQALALKPDYHQAHFAIADLTTGDEIEEHIRQLKTMLAELETSQREVPIEASMHLSHALAKEYEKQKKYQLEFATLLQAKQLKAKAIPYDRTVDKEIFEGLHSTLKAGGVNPLDSTNKPRPIFVVGMPRSGTTLVERILSNHSQVTSGGELEDFSLILKQLTNTASQSVLNKEVFKSVSDINYAAIAQTYLSRTAHIGNNKGHFVDKLPFNFFYLPFIRRAFPNAKIICLLRNPMDTCVGNFRQLFSIRNPHYHYTQSLDDCAWFYQEFESWISCWAQVDKANTKLVKYEELVTNPQIEIPKLIDFCDLAWQPQCLEVQSNQSPVSTASKMQVREPINQKSIDRWRRYHPYTTDIEQVLVK